MSSSSPPDAPASPELDSAEPVPGLWRRIFGRLDWQPPGWVPLAAARVRAEPRKYFGGLAALLLVAILGYWLATRPTPVRPDPIKVTVTGVQTCALPICFAAYDQDWSGQI